MKGLTDELLTCKCYGAMMHALPRDKQQLKKMSDAQIIQKSRPFINRVPAKNEQELDNWLVSVVNPYASNSNQLADLSELAELDGLGKKLKKLAKKAIAPIKKLAVDPLKKAFKKLEDSSTVKKIARPLAYAIGAATGTISAVQSLDQARSAAIAGKQAAAINDQVYQAQQAEVAAAFAPSPVQQAAPLPTYQPQSLEQQAAQYGQVQRLSQDNEQERPQIVGISANGIMDNIKQNPIPWAVGAGALLLLVMRNNNPQPYYPPHYAGGR